LGFGLVLASPLVWESIFLALIQQKATCFDTPLFVGSRSRWSFHPKGIKMLGRAKLGLRKSSVYAPNLRCISAAPL